MHNAYIQGKIYRSLLLNCEKIKVKAIFAQNKIRTQIGHFSLKGTLIIIFSPRK